MCDLHIDWVAIASMIAAVAAAFYARNAIVQAKKDAERALAQAKIVAERDEDDWAQRQWFELYVKADEVYDAIDKFRVSYPSVLHSTWDKPERVQDLNSLMVIFRAAARRCFVFPKHPAIDRFLKALEHDSPGALLTPEFLEGVSDASGDLRELAGVNPAVLKRKPMELLIGNPRSICDPFACFVVLYSVLGCQPCPAYC